jgi:hypothetical protein
MGKCGLIFNRHKWMPHKFPESRRVCSKCGQEQRINLGDGWTLWENVSPFYIEIEGDQK